MPQPADPFAAYYVQAKPRGAAPPLDDPFASYYVNAEPAPAGDAQRTLYSGDMARKPAATEDFVKPTGGWPATLGDVGIGFAKGAGSFVANTVGEGAANAGLIPGAHPSLLDPSMRNPVFTRAEEALTASNTAQRVGKVLEAGAEMLVPGGQAANAVPRAARSASKFQDVMSAARHIPVDVNAPGDVALRIVDMAQRGGGTQLGPPPVRQFIQWVTDPKKGPMTYEVARDFASNISKLSVKDSLATNPALAYEVANLRVALNKAVGEAAAKAGKGREYAEAMTEYAKAKRVQEIVKDVLTGAKKALPYAGAAAAGTWLTKQAMDLIGGD